MTIRASEHPMVTARAPGKINVYLRVGELLESGYHDLATAFQAVSLYETVSVHEHGEWTLNFTGTIDTSNLPTDDSNLAIRAAKAIAAEIGRDTPLSITIEKNVPIAGGMGGGSADAAATLVACDALWNAGIPKERMHEIAAELGSDVPFALLGGTAIGTGRGEELSPALAKGTFHWVLALSDDGLSTPEVYRELDRHRAENREHLSVPTARAVDEEVLRALRSGDAAMLAEYLLNDLQAPALRLSPGLADVIEEGERDGALASLVSGSGPTVAFLAAGQQEAIELQLALSVAGVRTRRVTGPVGGARVIDFTG